MNTDLYHMEGGSLPGCSGAFVVDPDNKLVAIVDGGLGEGQSGYNWAIPTLYLDDPERSNITELPRNVVDPPKILFLIFTGQSAGYF